MQKRLSKLKRELQYILLLPLISSGGNGPRLPGQRVVSKWSNKVSSEQLSAESDEESVEAYRKYQSLWVNIRRLLMILFFLAVFLIFIYFWQH